MKKWHHRGALTSAHSEMAWSSFGRASRSPPAQHSERLSEAGLRCCHPVVSEPKRRQGVAVHETAGKARAEQSRLSDCLQAVAPLAPLAARGPRGCRRFVRPELDNVLHAMRQEPARSDPCVDSDVKGPNVDLVAVSSQRQRLRNLQCTCRLRLEPGREYRDERSPYASLRSTPVHSPAFHRTVRLPRIQDKSGQRIDVDGTRERVATSETMVLASAISCACCSRSALH